MFHRVVAGQCVQGGRLGRSGNVSIYGGLFADESFEFGHDRGVLSMANGGANGNGSQFFVCLKRVAAWDGKHVVFGRVLSGLRVRDRGAVVVAVAAVVHVAMSVSLAVVVAVAVACG